MVKYEHRVGGKTYTSSKKRADFVKSIKKKSSSGSSSSGSSSSGSSKPNQIVVGYSRNADGTVSNKLENAPKEVKDKIARRTSSSGKKQTVSYDQTTKKYQVSNADGSKDQVIVGYTRDPTTGNVVNTLENVDEQSKNRLLQQVNSGQRVTVTQARRDTTTGKLTASEAYITSREIQKEESLKSNNQVPIKDVQAVPEPETRSEKYISNLNKLRQTERTLVQRGESGVFSPLKQLAIGAGLSALGTGLFFKNVVTKPKETVIQTAQGIAGVGRKIISGEGFPELGRTIKEEPFLALGFVGAEILTGRGLGEAGKFGANVIDVGRTVLDPRFQSAGKGSLLVGGEEVKLAGGVGSTAESIPSQIKQAGQEALPVSAQRSLFTRGVDEIVVDKPLPNPNSPALERSFFADPKGNIRTSRLGITEQKSASVIDMLSGDVTFSKTKPQVLVFERSTVENFPSSLSDVQAKLISGRTLSSSDEARLLRFQQTPSGKFKPLGFVSRESEITLAPNEVIIKKDVPVVTIINGKRVEVIRTQVSTRNFDTTVQTFDTPNINLNDLKKNQASLSSNIVNDASFISPAGIVASTVPLLSKSSTVSIPFVTSEPSLAPPSSTSPIGGGSGGSGRGGSGRGGSSNSSGGSGVSGGSSVISLPPSGGSSISPSPSPSPSLQPSPRGGSSVSPYFFGGSSPSPSNNFLLPLSSSPSKRTERGGYDVFVRKAGVFIKASKTSLKKQDALDFGAFAVQNSPRATFQLRASSGALGSTSTKKKGAFRKYRQNLYFKGGLYIEKRGKRITSSGEKAGITALGIQASKSKRKGLLKKIKVF